MIQSEKAKEISKAILILFLAFLVFQTAHAQPSTDKPFGAFETVVIDRQSPPRVYVVTELPVTSRVMIGVRDIKNMEVAQLTTDIKGGRIATEIPWKMLDPRGFIPFGAYTFDIFAQTITDKKPIKIGHFGIAIGYPSSLDALNAVKIMKIVPDPVEKEAKIEYLLGTDSLVTLDIVDRRGVMVDNVLTRQKRDRGKNEDAWKRDSKAKPGIHLVKIISIDKFYNARDQKEFKCK